MCGICGSVGFENGQSITRQMNRAMLHRGPDSAGFLDDAPVHLGMRRLRIIDLNTGDQPIYNEDHSVAIVFNGEIYNFQELFDELVVLGHRFTTHCDTETIVHAYEEWGTDCPNHLRGMFAFAIYDRRPPKGQSQGEWRLFVARDRMGIKPLYYYQQDDGGLLFASEVRALLASGKVPKNLSVGGLYTYLAFGSLQEPLTLVEGIRSLSPASWLLVESQGQRWTIRQNVYWEPPFGQAISSSPDDVRSWLSDAVGSHLVSDVPLGAFLSGGLDSGSIVALGSQALERPMRTFTLAFDNWPSDERETAALTARRWRSEHQCRVISEQEILADLPQAISAMDLPTIDGINSWYVSREARRAGLTVALSGVGGDELFAGYPSFRHSPRLARLPHGMHWLAKLPGWQTGWPDLPGSADTRRKLAAYLAGEMPLSHPYFAVRGLLTHWQIETLLLPEINERLQAGSADLLAWKQSVSSQIEQAKRYDAVGEVSWLEMSQYMRSTLLRDTDMMSMAHSLEVRVPLVDHQLVERILTVSGARKIVRGRPKPLMMDAMEGLLPSEITHLGKRTFTFPFQTWLRQGLSEKVKQSLLNAPESLRSWIDPAATAETWLDFERGRTNWARPWALYILDEWVRCNL